MSRLQTIENELKSINGAVFQELCDHYLTLRNKSYKAISRSGSQTGKQKTTKGTPDTFFLLENGNFLFSEMTTDSSTKEKLENDIKACFNSKKTKIPNDKIEEIILCFNWNLDQERVSGLTALAQSFNSGIKICFVTLNELSLELHLNHRDLAHHYLGIPLDSGQIVSIDNFIKEYNRASKGIATPLDNEFLHRKNETYQLKSALDAYDFIILTGSPGVGKTKLGIETIKSYIIQNKNFKAYCISYKHHHLLDDLYQYFDKDNDYILFVDDANRIDAFNQITGFYKSTRTGKLKIIITVRDYALKEIRSKCHGFLTTKLEISKFTDEEIVEIIKSKPFEILNPDYHREILRIADGNPRLAIMTSLLAKEKQDLFALHNVSDLFERYYSTFIADNNEFSNNINIKTLGLISFFYTIPYKKREITESILNNFELSYGQFIDSIDRLEKLELVEIQYEHVKIPEQNISTFFFYKCFIKNDLLSFKTLLDYYFEDNQYRFTDTVVPANNTFGAERVMDKLKPYLISYWNTIKTEKEKAFKFLKTFWFYLQDQSLTFIFEFINELPEKSEKDFIVDYDNNDFNYNKDNIIELLGNFYWHNNNHLKDSLELSFGYVNKKPEKLAELIYKIRAILVFDRDDERFSFYRQKTLFDVIIEGVEDKDILYIISFFEIAKTFLQHNYQLTKGGRNNSFVIYQYQIPLNKSIKAFRKRIWEITDKEFKNHPSLAFNLMKNHKIGFRELNNEILQFDVPHIIKLIDKHFDIQNFEHCKYVQDQVKWFKKNEIIESNLFDLKRRFINSTYSVYLKIDWDRFRDKEIYDFENFREYDKLKEDEIRNTFVFQNFEETKKFYDSFVLLNNLAENNWNYNNSFDFVVDENFSHNPRIGKELLNLVINSNNEINYVPGIVLRNNLNEKKHTKELWSLIESNNFKFKDDWKLNFFYNLDEKRLNQSWLERLLETIKEIEVSNFIRLQLLENFLKKDEKLFQKILKIIYDFNNSKESKLQLWYGTIDNYFEKLGDDFVLIKKTYLQQYSIQKHFDLDGKGFKKILKIDPIFLVEFVESLYANSKKHSLGGSHNDFSYIWEIKGIENSVEKVFDLCAEKDLYLGILEHYCNVFFKNLKNQNKEHADNFLKNYVIKNNRDFKKMQIVVDIIRHTRNELFEEILLLFISQNQDKEIFKRLYWRGNGGTYSGDVIIGDIEAADWRNILSIVEKSSLGFRLLPIKTYISNQIEYALQSGERERERKFLTKRF